jgi:hypothetical protein
MKRSFLIFFVGDCWLSRKENNFIVNISQNQIAPLIVTSTSSSSWYVKLIIITMKRISLNFRIACVVLIAGLAITSCKKDSSSEVTLAGGTWTAGTPTFTVMVGTKTLTQYYTDVMGLTAAQASQFTAIVSAALVQSFTGTIQFKSDNTYTANLGGTPDSGTWSLSPDGKKLTIDSNTDAPETADITQLTSNKLVVTLTDTESEDLNSDGTPETLTITVTLPFTR